MLKEKGQYEGSFNQKLSCLPPCRVTERALSDAGERQASTKPPDPTSLICQWKEEEGVTKARALDVIRKGLMSCSGPGVYHGRPQWEAIQRPGVDHKQSLAVHRWICRTLLCVYIRLLCCGE